VFDGGQPSHQRRGGSDASTARSLPTSSFIQTTTNFSLKVGTINDAFELKPEKMKHNHEIRNDLHPSQGQLDQLTLYDWTGIPNTITITIP
jgi:outer membrane lipoprotein-sorting protein